MSELQPVLVDGAWRPARSPRGRFHAVNPATGEDLPDSYPTSSFEDLEEALVAARRTAFELEALSPDAIASFLDRFAERILERADEIVAAAHLETALPAEPRLRLTELPRTTNQLHQAAAAARDRSWCRATIDEKLNIRSKYGPLGGPVVIFSPNNFPLAFNSATGGDFAAAVAAGNPVVAKAHPGHPGTTKLFAEITLGCLKETGLPPAMLQMVYHLTPEDGLKLVSHPIVGATAFTGSRPAGLGLKAAAERAGKPIYLEMSASNPVFVLPGALRERGSEIASELFASCSLGAGQFCTKPGLVIVLRDARAREFENTLRKLFEQPPSGFLLSRTVVEGLRSAVDRMTRSGANVLAGGRSLEGPGFRFENTLLKTSGKRLLAHPAAFQNEAFGTATLLVCCENTNEMGDVCTALEGNLSASIYSARNGDDDPLYRRIEPVLRTKVGRLLNDKMPTGIAVVPSMVHGGPFPAAGHPGFTAVGFPASMLRFAALRCYDNVRPDRLPPELRDRNPTGTMWRLINGDWTKRDLSSATSE